MRSASCAPKSCWRRTSSTAPSSTSPAPWISATRSAPRKRSQKWGRSEILGDFVRHIRTLRPDVIVTLGVDGTGGGQHHQTSAVIAAEAYKAAADPEPVPRADQGGPQAVAGEKAVSHRRRDRRARPRRSWRSWRTRWAAAGEVQAGGADPHPGRATPPAAAGGPTAPGAAPADPNAHFATIDTNVYEPLLGCTIAEVGGVASGMHMCQGRAPLVPAPGLSGARYRLVETVLASQRDKDETSLFEGVDTSLMGLSRFAGAKQSDALVRGLAIASAHVAAATQGARLRRSRRRRPAARLRPVRDPRAAFEPGRRGRRTRAAGMRSTSGWPRRKSSFRTRWSWRSRCASKRLPTTA